MGFCGAIGLVFAFQAYNDVMQGRFPATTQMLVRLAALRIQYEVGDYRSGASMYAVLAVLL